MKIIETFIDGLFVIEPDFINEEIITYSKKWFDENNLTLNFIQENESYSKRNVLRGFHLQLDKPQGKLVKIVEGEIFDVVVDMRKNSKTFLKWYGVYLSEQNKKSLYVPEGLAHGFLVMSDFAKVNFKVSNLWNPADEIGIPWNDSTLNIKWPLGDNEPIIAEKDLHYTEIKNSNIEWR